MLNLPRACAERRMSVYQWIALLLSAKKGCISDLTYDNIQEEKIQISCTRKGRNVEHALECKLDYDVEQAVINAALNEQAADLDY